MRASELVGPRRSQVVEAPDPEPGPGEVVVRVLASGVCASEVLAWRTGTAGTRLGHEVTGQVEAVGPGVTTRSVGELVTGLAGRGFSELVVTREDRLLPVPTDVAPEASLGEPLCCVVNAVRRSRVVLGDRIAIVGLGSMGLSVLQVARLEGPSHILAIDVRAEARALALQAGADAACEPSQVAPDLLAGRDRPDAGLDVVFEVSGTQAGLDLAGALVRQHGILSIVGYHQGGPRTVDMEAWNFKAIDVINAHVRRDSDRIASMRIGLDLIAAGRLDLGWMVTHRYRLDELDRAFGDLETKPAGFVKGVVFPADA
jgi:threonine dehydrogenase-like Zn-dependent dehydrogenase